MITTPTPTLHDRALAVGAQPVMDVIARAKSVPGGQVSMARLMRGTGLLEGQVKNALYALRNLGCLELSANALREDFTGTVAITSAGWAFTSVPRPIWMEDAA